MIKHIHNIQHYRKRKPKYPKLAKWTLWGTIASASVGITAFITQMLQYDNIRSWAGAVGMICAGISAAAHLMNKTSGTSGVNSSKVD